MQDKRKGIVQFFLLLLGRVGSSVLSLPVRVGYGSETKTNESPENPGRFYSGDFMIPDKAVQELYERCCTIPLDSDSSLDPDDSLTQLFRGVHPTKWRHAPHPRVCDQYMEAFELFKIIPEYCFSCYKVSIVPSSVVELFKLAMVFERMQLPNDNTRKCWVEMRRKISGSYKGLIYCQDLEEGKEVLNVSRTLIDEEISGDVQISLKRGCSEYALVYSEYGDVKDNREPLMAYKEEWREKEKFAEMALAKRPPRAKKDSYNHHGFNVRDSRVMCSWLAYAAAIGDTSYLSISQSPVCPMPGLKRPQL